MQEQDVAGHAIRDSSAVMNRLKSVATWVILRRREHARRKDWRRKRIYVAPGSFVDLRTSIGRCTRINHASHIGECEIGAYCAIGGRLVVRSSNHETRFLNVQSWSQRHVIGSAVPVSGVSKRPVRIGHGAWIGDSVIVLPGVTIGDGAVIGAGSVVTKSVAAYAIAVGNPARVIRYRFSDEIIALLGEVRWWEWSERQIQDNRWLFETDLSALSGAEFEQLLSKLGELRHA